ncbi:hypothetical protein MZT64_001419 [Serratia marcescens]|nr:hypothetical protein [Serratia marcescens]
MEFSKLFSTLTAISTRTNEKYKYEIFQELSGGSYFAVISAQQDFVTKKYGTKSVWVEIEGCLRLTSTNVLTCEEECKRHFESM